MKLRRARRKQKRSWSSFDDMIIDHILDPENYPLGDDEEIIRHYNLVTKADDLIRRWGTNKATSILVKEYGLTITKAASICNSSQYIFGSTCNLDKKVHISHTIASIKETREIALIAKDLKAVAMCDSNLLKAADLIEDEQSDQEVATLHTIEITPDIKLLNLEPISDSERRDFLQRIMKPKAHEEANLLQS